MYTIVLYATGLGRPDHRSSRDEDPMRGSRRSTLSRSAGLVIVPLLAFVLLALPPVGGDHTNAGVEVFLTVVGDGTSDPFALFFDVSEIILGPTPVFVNVNGSRLLATTMALLFAFADFLVTAAV